ncbi:hypothetical protein AB6A40_003129 [Gnathostoma spinigerum]|uniref:Uncharacterized protein n=1 Tax=Gnathostoma spinigerum TaxID=75299 RepID=A0ABD6E9U1_9BILA
MKFHEILRITLSQLISLSLLIHLNILNFIHHPPSHLPSIHNFVSKTPRKNTFIFHFTKLNLVILITVVHTNICYDFIFFCFLKFLLLLHRVVCISFGTIHHVFHDFCAASYIFE